MGFPSRATRFRYSTSRRVMLFDFLLLPHLFRSFLLLELFSSQNLTPNNAFVSLTFDPRRSPAWPLRNHHLPSLPTHSHLHTPS